MLHLLRTLPRLLPALFLGLLLTLTLILAGCGGGGGVGSPFGSWSITGVLNTSSADTNPGQEDSAHIESSDIWTIAQDGANFRLSSVNLKGASIAGQPTVTANGGHYEGWTGTQQANVAGAPWYYVLHFVVDVYINGPNSLYATEAIEYYGYNGNNPAFGINPVPASESWKIVGVRN